MTKKTIIFDFDDFILGSMLQTRSLFKYFRKFGVNVEKRLKHI